MLWASVTDLPSDLQGDEDAALDALEFASFVLWSLSGRMYTPVQVTQESYDTTQTLAWGAQVYPLFMDGVPYNTTACGNCACQNCGVFHRTRLRGYPVRRILGVAADGRIISPSECVILDYSVLGLTSLDSCNVRCLTVEYEYGTGVPAGGKNAVAKLAEELLRNARGEPCRLPERVTSFSRQGVSYTMLDPQDFLDKGRTGIYEIDLLLSTLNPSRALKRARVFSPDIRRAETHTYAPAPPIISRRAGTQVVAPGSPTQWLVSDTSVLDQLFDTKSVHGLRSWTELSNGVKLHTQWYLAPGGKTASLPLTAEQTANMWGVTEYRVYLPDGSPNGRLVLSGPVVIQ
jgi:hypothetical protein